MVLNQHALVCFGVLFLLLISVLLFVLEWTYTARYSQAFGGEGESMHLEYAACAYAYFCHMSCC